MYKSNDPIADYDRYDDALQREAAKRQKCAICGNPICVDDYYYEINDEKICEDCMIENYRLTMMD